MYLYKISVIELVNIQCLLSSTNYIHLQVEVNIGDRTGARGPHGSLNS